MRVLYLDILFLVNFCMDYMALYITGALRGRRRRAVPLLTAAFIGAVYAVLAVLFEGSEAIQSIIGILVSLLLTGIAYGFQNKREFARTFLVFYAVSLLLGAIITVAYSLLNRYVRGEFLKDEGGGRRMLVFLIAATVGGILIRLCGGWLAREEKMHNCRVSVWIADKKATFDALVDSGNLLTDPLSGRRVIVVGLAAVRALFPPQMIEMLEKHPTDPRGIDAAWARRIRMIPARSIGGTRLLVGLLPDKMTVSRENGKKQYLNTVHIDAILAIDTDSVSKYGGFDAVMPVGLSA